MLWRRCCLAQGPWRLYSSRHKPRQGPAPSPRQIKLPSVEKSANESPAAKKRPKPMVEFQPKKSLIKGLISRIFSVSDTSKKAATQKLRQEQLANIGLGKDLKFLNTNHVTNILYWYCIDLTFTKADFVRLLPDKSLRVGNYGSKFDEIPFEVRRARNPVNLTRWMGYFLTYESKEAATVYYQETLGLELAGTQLKWRFVDQHIRGYSSPLLERVPGLSRRCHALILGLPVGTTPRTILRTLWDYDFIDDDNYSVEQVPVERIKYGGSPFVLRFKSEDEAARFVKDFDKSVFPYTDQVVSCEVVD